MVLQNTVTLEKASILYGIVFGIVYMHTLYIICSSIINILLAPSAYVLSPPKSKEKVVVLFLVR
jgi:hypothetical protein